jgi:hypothetical protein
MGLALVHGGEETRGFDNPFNTLLTPLDVFGFSAGSGQEFVFLAIDGDNQLVRVVATADFTSESTVDGVVLEEVGHGIRLKSGVVDDNNFDFREIALEEHTENKATDAAESVDANFDHNDKK